MGVWRAGEEQGHQRLVLHKGLSHTELTIWSYGNTYLPVRPQFPQVSPSFGSREEVVGVAYGPCSLACNRPLITVSSQEGEWYHVPVLQMGPRGTDQGRIAQRSIVGPCRAWPLPLLHPS